MTIDPGRAATPRISVPLVLPSPSKTGSASAILEISWFIPTPHTIVVYASKMPLAVTPATLTTGQRRYTLPGRDFHPLETHQLRLAHFAYSRERCSWAVRVRYTPAGRQTRCALPSIWSQFLCLLTHGCKPLRPFLTEREVACRAWGNGSDTSMLAATIRTRIVSSNSSTSSG